MKYSTDLSNVVKGDILGIKRKDMFHSNWELLAVERTTNTQVLLTNGKKFYKDHGWEVVSGSMRYEAVIPSPELLKDVEKKQAIAEIKTKIEKGFLNSLDGLQLQKIINILG